MYIAIVSSLWLPLCGTDWWLRSLFWNYARLFWDVFSPVTSQQTIRFQPSRQDIMLGVTVSASRIKVCTWHTGYLLSWHLTFTLGGARDGGGEEIAKQATTVWVCVVAFVSVTHLDVFNKTWGWLQLCLWWPIKDICHGKFGHPQPWLRQQNLVFLKAITWHLDLCWWRPKQVF